MKRTALFIAALASVLTLGSVTIANAGTATSALAVGTSVISNCTQMPSALSASLTYDVFQQGWSFAYMGSNTINCTKGSFPQLAFSGGNGINDCGGLYYGDNLCRAMVDGKGNRLNYLSEVCFYPISINNSAPQPDSACLPSTGINWYGESVQPAAEGNSSSERTSFWYYAYIPSGQDVPVGSYTDSFTMTLNY